MSAIGARMWQVFLPDRTVRGPTVRIYESFNKADGPGLGPDLTWNLDGDPYGWRTTGSAAHTTTAGLAFAWTTATVGNANSFCELTISSQEEARVANVLIRGDGTSPNGYYATAQRLDPVQTEFWLRKYDGGFTDLTARVPLAITPTYKLRIEAIGDNLELFVNDSSVASITDSQFSDGTTVGISTNRETVFFDDLFAGSAPYTGPPPVEPVIIDFSTATGTDGQPFANQTIGGIAFQADGNPLYRDGSDEYHSRPSIEFTNVDGQRLISQGTIANMNQPYPSAFCVFQIDDISDTALFDKSWLFNTLADEAATLAYRFESTSELSQRTQFPRAFCRLTDGTSIICR